MSFYSSGLDPAEIRDNSLRWKALGNYFYNKYELHFWSKLDMILERTKPSFKYMECPLQMDYL